MEEVAKYTDINQEFASDAFYATSWDPDKRGEQYTKMWAYDVNQTAEYLRSLPKNDEQREKCESLIKTYYRKSKELFESFLSAHSRCMSWAITGPSKFPTAKANAAGNRADNKMAEYYTYCENAKQKYARIIQNTMTDEEKAKYRSQEVLSFFRKLNEDISLAIAVSEKKRGEVPSYVKTNMIQSLKSRFETLWRNREYAAFNEGLDLIVEKTKGTKAVLFAKNNSIWERWDGCEFDSLPKCQEFEYIMDRCYHFYELKEKPTQESVENYQEAFNHCFSQLRHLDRVLSFQIAANQVKQMQEDLGIKIVDPEGWVFKKAESLKVKLETAKNNDVETSDIYVADGVRIEDNLEDQRVRIYFDSIPDANIRSDLKHNGFKWAPSVSAWQRQNTPQARNLAIKIIRKYFPDEIKPEAPTQAPLTESDNSKRAHALLLKMRMSRATLD